MCRLLEDFGETNLVLIPVLGHKGCSVRLRPTSFNLAVLGALQNGFDKIHLMFQDIGETVGKIWRSVKKMPTIQTVYCTACAAQGQFDRYDFRFSEV